MNKIKKVISAGFAAAVLIGCMGEDNCVEMNNESFFLSGIFSSEKDDDSKITIIEDKDVEIKYDFRIAEIFRNLFS